jgi:dTDP-4-amino-4,6-dideoxygalactose transaminase
MNKSKIWLSSPHMGGSEPQFVNKALDPDRVVPLGRNIDGFQEDIKKHLDQDVFVCALSSGTAAIHLGLILMGVKGGDAVLCQSMTFSASANPILYLGATPIFVDSELDTWNLCPLVLEEAIKDCVVKGQKPKAIIAVHSYGVPYKVDEIEAIARKYKIPVLEDGAEALGSRYKGRQCGTFGDFGVLSFNVNKIITTYGGGVLVTKTEELKNKAIFLSTQSKDDAPHYEHSELGYNYQMSTIGAGIGRGQMEVLDRYLSLRREMHGFYERLFADIDSVSVYTVPNDDYFSNYWLTTILINPKKNNGITRETLRLALESENIESRPLWKPLHLQPVFRKYPYYGHAVAETLFENGLCLPSGSNLTDADRERIAGVVKRLFG